MKKTKKGLGEIEEIAIAFIETAFNAEQNVGVCLIEFKTPVKEHLLKKQLEDIGGTQVTLETFPSGDANETASSALLHIWMMKDKTELGYGNGICSKQLSDKTTAKYNAEKKRREDVKLESGKSAEDIKKVDEFIAKKLDAILVDNKAAFGVVATDVKDTKTTLVTLVTDSFVTVEDSITTVNLKVGAMATVLGSKIDEKNILAQNLNDKNLATEKAQNKTNHDKGLVTKECNSLREQLAESELRVPKTISQLKKQADKDKLEMQEKANEDKLDLISELRAEMKARDDAHSAEMKTRDDEAKTRDDEAKTRDDEAKEHYKRVETMLFAMQTELGMKRDC